MDPLSRQTSVQQTEGHSNYFSIFTFSNIDDLHFRVDQYTIPLYIRKRVT